MSRPVIIVGLVMLVVVAAFGSASAVPNHGGEVRAPTVPNQKFDEIIAETKERIEAVGWDTYKNVQSVSSDFPLFIETNNNSPSGSSVDSFKITKAHMAGFGIIQRSAGAEYMENNMVLNGTILFPAITISSDYEISFAGASTVDVSAPEDYRKGTVVEEARVFVDLQVNLNSSEVVQSIKSYSVRVPRTSLTTLSNMKGNYTNVHSAGIKQALAQQIEKTVNTNIKVKVNQAIQGIKNGN